MRERLGLWLLLLGTFVAARVAVAFAVTKGPPRSAPFALHAAAIPAVQAAAIALLFRPRRKEPR